MDSRNSKLRLARVKLIGFCALLMAAAAVFGYVAGPPRAPGALPGLEDVMPLLTGASLPLAPLAVVLIDAVWLLWIWIFGSLLLELLLSIVEAVAHGANWVYSLRHVTDRFSAPLARKVVAAAFAVQLVSRSVPIVSAQTLDPTEVELVTREPASSDAAVAAREETSEPTYLVRDGDTLWSIAESAYGSGDAYRQIIDANVGRRMPDGKVFSARGVIQPGWELVLPGTDLGTYVVQPGDTLSSIAATRLDDKERWSELFDVNRGLNTPDGRHTLSNPNVIWPGLRLHIPISEDPASSSEPAAAEPTDMVAAAAPAVIAESASVPSAETLALANSDTSAATLPPEAEAPPLLRTQHALDPVALEPVDAAPPEQEEDISSLPQETASADGGVPVPEPSWYARVPAGPLAAGGVGLAAIAGLAYGAHRMRRRLGPLPQEPESEVVVEGGFAEAQLAQDLTRGLHGVGFDPLTALLAHLEHFLGEYNLGDVGVIAVRHGRSSTTLTLRCSLAEQALLVDLAPVFAERLGADAEAWVTPDQDVALQLTRLRRTRLLPSADRVQTATAMVPLGVLYDRQVYSAAWDALGHVLIASLPGHGADTIVTSLVATLTARRSPEQLRIWMVAAPRALPAPVNELPHLERVVDPTDSPSVASAVADLRAELDRRAANPAATDLAIVIPELAMLGEHAEDVAMLATSAAQLGVRLVCASTTLDQALSSPLTSYLTTRMVLRMQDEETSVALLGVADAAFLSGGGRLLVRLDGREPVELYGYQVSAEHLERLIKLMRSAYQPAAAQRVDASPPTPSVPPATAPPDGRVEDAQSTETPSEKITPPAEIQTSLDQDAIRPPIHVICFGGPRVLCAGQQLWPNSASGDAKPWELLLYLACQPADGVPRDEVVEALWPEHDEPEDAPHRFRQLRYRLRRLLLAAPNAPDTEGICLAGGRMRLDPAIVFSEAHEFMALVRSARTLQAPDAIEPLERARGLYAGDLLEGPDAHRYAWVTERDGSGVTLREHFRRQFQQVTQRLAELYKAAGKLESALELYRELSEMDPTDEQVWLALFRLHVERGDRLGLMREERRMRESLRELIEEFGPGEGDHIAELSRETSLEYQRLLADLREREPATA